METTRHTDKELREIIHTMIEFVRDNKKGISQERYAEFKHYCMTKQV